MTHSSHHNLIIRMNRFSNWHWLMLRLTMQLINKSEWCSLMLQYSTLSSCLTVLFLLFCLMVYDENYDDADADVDSLGVCYLCIMKDRIVIIICSTDRSFGSCFWFPSLFFSSFSFSSSENHSFSVSSSATEWEKDQTGNMNRSSNPPPQVYKRMERGEQEASPPVSMIIIIVMITCLTVIESIHRQFLNMIFIMIQVMFLASFLSRLSPATAYWTEINQSSFSVISCPVRSETTSTTLLLYYFLSNCSFPSLIFFVYYDCWGKCWMYQQFTYPSTMNYYFSPHLFIYPFFLLLPYIHWLTDSYSTHSPSVSHSEQEFIWIYSPASGLSGLRPNIMLMMIMLHAVLSYFLLKMHHHPLINCCSSQALTCTFWDPTE